MKYLGIDYGTKRVGIAISDEAGEFAFPKAIVDSTNAIENIVALCTNERIDAIVIGESVATNEEQNLIHKEAMRFVEKIRSITKLPVVFEREDFSSVEAHRYQTKAGNRDDSAAAIILQRYLDKLDKKAK